MPEKQEVMITNGQEVFEILDNLVEEHRVLSDLSNYKETDDTIFTIIVYLYLDEKGYDVEKFGSELVELSKRRNMRRL